MASDLKDRGRADDRSLLGVIDGAKALRKALKDHFGKLDLIQRCQIHNARGILERLPPHLRTGTSKALRQAFKADSEEVGKKLLDNLARRLYQEADGVAGAIREGMDDMLTCVSLGLPDDLRRFLVSTNQIENLIGRVHQLCKNVCRWRDARRVQEDPINRNNLVKYDIVRNCGRRMEKWFPPGYERLDDIFERTGKRLFGAKWHSEAPACAHLQTPSDESEVGAQSRHVFEHLRN